MAHIVFTVQKPDEHEAHEISLSGDVNEAGNQDSSIRDGSQGVPPPSVPSRRSSTLSTSGPISSGTLQQRKFSFPTALPGNFLGIETTGISARRRFSNVSDAVTRKLSNTIGWKTSQKQCREIVTVGKSLCSQYIRNRLKRSGYLNKKCGLQRVRSAISLGGVVFREVYPELVGLGVELERLHPKVYANITRQASTFPGGRLSSEKEVGAILTAVSRELLKNDVTWAKVVSLFAVAGGLAVDCARQGHYDYLGCIVETMEDILEDDLAQWIQYKGGWYALVAITRPPTSEWPTGNLPVLLLLFFLVTVVIVVLLSNFGISSFT
ncbi:hypothetical protein RUM43_008817 [Polyplax serrata]|uniref:Bcl-2 Bcl-2 homology region 1-3 domain-containing protein n=1 Tax=Polyplax serrata TaxID=468196 RepID=A0AAN8NU96_POLSC